MVWVCSKRVVFKQNTENVDSVVNQVSIVQTLKSYHNSFLSHVIVIICTCGPVTKTDTAEAEVSLEISGGCKVVKLYDTRIQVTN